MTIFFTSDTHFGHKNILHLVDRETRMGVSTIEEHDTKLIELWNSVVGEKDDVYHLGDFGLTNRKGVERVMNEVNGNVHLILGNHQSVKGGLRDRFVWVRDYYKLKVPDEEHPRGEQEVILFHYPIAIWDKRHHGAWHLHGHCHGSFPSGDGQPRLDVGVDVHDFKPISYEQVKAHMVTKGPLENLDHHGRKPRY